VAQQLRVDIPVAAGVQSPMPNPAAYEEYLRGRFAFQRRRDAASVAEAIRSFEESIRRDPSFAMSHALLGASLAVLPSYSESADLIGTFARAQGQAQQALVLDPRNAMAYAVLGYCALGVDPLLAERNLQHSLSLAPNSVDARHWYHLLLVSVGRLNAGIDEGERALALDPVSAPLYNSLAEAYFLVGKLDMAQTYARRSQAMGIADINQVLSKLALQQGDIDGSARLAASDDQDSLAVMRLLHAALLDSKAVPAARQALESEMRKEAWPARGWSQLNLRLLLGDLDGALAALDELEHRLGPERALQNFLSADLWDPQSQIRAHYADRQFQSLLERTHLLAYYRETGTTPDLCRWAGAEMRCSSR
jgi:tetratricopeptide (TPR) repeat protein